MVVRTQIGIDSEKFNKALQKYVERTEDLRIPFYFIARDFLRSRTGIFQRKSKGAYPDLSENYKPIKEEKWGRIYPILYASGRLAKSLTSFGGENITEIGKKSLVLGTSVPYSGNLQFGSEKDNIPPRPFLFFGYETVKNRPKTKGPYGTEGFASRAIRTLENYVLRNKAK